jgi:hypothetical protein
VSGAKEFKLALFFLSPKDINELHMRGKLHGFYTVSGWRKINFLVHGFGTKHWDFSDFRRHAAFIDFRILSLRQIHSDIIHIITDIPRERKAGDAVLTNLPHLLLTIKTADCLPVLLLSVEKRAVGAVHCGWKSTSQRLLPKTVQVLKKHFGVDASALQAALGPCIGAECYEVGEDVWNVFKNRGFNSKGFRPHPLREGKYLLDLRQVNRDQLIDAGVRTENILSVDICTSCSEDLLSYRRNKKEAGRMLNFIGLSF